MKTLTLKREWLLWLVILSPLVLVLAKWSEFPARIPMHWNVEGEVDQYGGKAALFMGPGINLAIYLLLIFLPGIDPRKKNYDLFSGAYFMIRAGIAVFLSLLGVVTALVSLGTELNVGLIVMLGVLGLFLIIGNQFSRIRPNYFVGLRTPWTLNNAEVWTKTHRLAGRVWVSATLLMMVLVWFFPLKIFAFFFIAYIVVIVIIPAVYSWKLHKSLEKN